MQKSYVLRFQSRSFFFFSGGGGCEASAEAHSISVRLNLYMVRRSRDEMGRDEDGAGVRMGRGEREERKVGMSRALLCAGESDNVVDPGM